MNHKDLWKQVLNQIELDTSKANFATWFQNTNLESIDDGRAVVSVPNAFAKEWLEKKYHKSIVRALRGQANSIRSVGYLISSQKDFEKQHVKPNSKAALNEEQLEFKEFSVDRETNLNPKYTFDTFIVGSFNELAHAAALSKKRNPILKILYLTSEKFMNELISLIQNREPLNSFKEKYRNVDLLIIDDVQFIAGKAKTEEEFFHTFNVLYENGKQIVFSSDRPPQAIPNLEERLRSRFEAGLIADIGEPEYEARLAILKSKISGSARPLSDEVLEYIASVIQKNIRELEGALNLLNAKEKVKEAPLTLDEVKNTLNQLSARSQRVVSTQQILKVVSVFYNIDERDLLARSRKREIVKPRQVAMYLIREDFNGSYPYIGQKLGGRDHTTALHGYDKISKAQKKT